MVRSTYSGSAPAGAGRGVDCWSGAKPPGLRDPTSGAAPSYSCMHAHVSTVKNSVKRTYIVERHVSVNLGTEAELYFYLRATKRSRNRVDGIKASHRGLYKWETDS